MNLSEQKTSHFARVDFRHDQRLFGIRQSDRLMGMYLLGKTGAGKTNLMKVLMHGDIVSGRGFCLFDVNGDVIKEVVDLVPPERQKDLIYLNAGDMEQAWGYNPLRRVPYITRPLIASSILSTFKKLWGVQAWGVKLEYILRNTILTLLDQEKASFDDIPLLLLDEDFRLRCLSRIENPHVKRFWEYEYP
jgi:hypothetical protein